MQIFKHADYLKINGVIVRCSICRKKIKVDSDFSTNGGSVTHTACHDNAIAATASTRRKTIKLAGVGALMAGAAAMGLGGLARGAGVDQTTVTSQGVILPSLTSDPSNPEPGQEWYRSDAGVLAYMDGVENKVKYTKKSNGEVTVSAKGISNGLSTIPNDGADAGPDTTQGATSPGQIGLPYSQSSGINESFNFLPQMMNPQTNRTVPNGRVFLKDPLVYRCAEPVIVYEDWNIDIEGVLGSSGNSSQDMTVIGGFNDKGGFHCLTCPADTGTAAFGGQLIMKNFTVIDYDIVTNTFYTYSTGVTNSKGVLINYLGISVISTPDTLIIDNVSYYLHGDNGGMYLVSNGFETVWIVNYMWGNSGTTQHSAFKINAFHTIIGTIDIGASTGYPSSPLPSSVTQFPTVWYGYGPRAFVNSMHIGGNAYYPLCIVSNSLNENACFINNLFFEIGVPPLLSNGTMPMCSNPSTPIDSAGGATNFNFYGHIIVGALNGEFYPLICGFISPALSNLFEVLSLTSGTNNSGAPWNSSTGIGWYVPGSSGGSPPQSPIKLPKSFRSIYTTTDLAYNTQNPPTAWSYASGTVNQNATPYRLKVVIPVYATTSGTAGSVTVAKGTSSTPSAIYTKFINGSTSSTATEVIEIELPPYYYFSITFTGITIGTPTVFAD